VIRRALGALAAAFALVVLGDLGTAYAADPVDCTATPEDPACVTESPSPTPTPTVTVTATATVTATPEAVPAASATATYGPFAPTGIVLDPATGEVAVSEDAGVAFGVVLWLGSVVAGVVTTQKVMP
jgi:hypothetical protein